MKPCKQPLVVHLVFHPESEEARQLACHVQRALHDDPAVPGLAIPTVIVPEDGTLLPSANYDLDEAEHSAVVVLADADMVLDSDDVPPGRVDWNEFVAGLYRACDGERHRFIPIQLVDAAWPIHSDLEEVAFARASVARVRGHDLGEWVVRRTVIELLRFLSSVGRGEQAPIRLFLSHAKADIDRQPQAFNAIVEHLRTTEPVETWIDSAKISAGSRFSEEIGRGASDAGMLAIVTRSYSGRPWCGKEILMAKQHGRPLVVVDALDHLDRRAFPYLGNVPVIRWSEQGDAAGAVDLLLKETLRLAHVRACLERIKLPGDVVFASPPELVTLVGVERGTQVLYPDPAIEDAQRELLEFTGTHINTPFQRLSRKNALASRRVALSISESNDIERWGLLPSRLDAAMLELSRHLLIAGASLAYGGHLGSDGYTAALFEMRDAHRRSSPQQAVERIVNFVGWPLPYKQMDKNRRAALTHNLRFRRVPRPEEIADLEPGTFIEEPKYFPPDSPERRYAWARGMTAMREAQTSETDARIIIGGKVGPTMTAQLDGTKKCKWYSGRIPGVYEEAILSLRAAPEHRVYIMGAFGGAGAAVAELLEGRDRKDLDWAYQRQAPYAEEMREIYRARHVPFEDYNCSKQWLRDYGLAGLSARNKLTEEENRELLWTRDVVRAIELILVGLTRR